MDSLPPVLTIGYGSRTLDEFVDLLRAVGATDLADVRSAPYSRYKPEFSREPLGAHLAEAGIRYIFMGDALGGRPNDPACYDASGHVDYERCRLRPEFAGALEALEAGRESGLRIALMCSEERPEECHRSKLVAEELCRLGSPVTHVDERGELRSHDEVMARITGGQEPLFGEHATARRSRGQYRVA